jgi:Putative metallopeptidase
MRTPALAALLALPVFGWSAPVGAAQPALHSDQFRVVYEAPKNGAHQLLYEDLKSRHVLEKFREFLSFIRLPRILTLKLAGCDGEDNAWYEPEELSITVCYEYVEGVQRVAPESVTPGGVTPDSAVLGPLLEVFLHEIGHALFDQLRIPLLGHEEDAADQFAAFVMLHLNPQTARDAMAGVAWMYGQEAKDAKISQSSLANVHGLAGQRFYNTLCMAYGAEPELFNALVERKLLPEDRAEGCEDEYRQVAYAINTLMSPYIDVSTRDKVLAKDWAGGKLRMKTATEARPR